MLTPLVFPKLHGLFFSEIVGIHLGVKAVERFENDCQRAGARVNGTPRCYGFQRIDLRFDVLQMLLSKTLNGFALPTDALVTFFLLLVVSLWR